MATTTNFGWTTPNDTDLVKNGAAAIRTLGSAVDTSLAQLKGGTTGQVLSKTSNTDMAFTWVAQDDSNAIQNALLTTTGDTIYASSASTPARLAIGSSGQALTVVAGVPSWAASATSVLTTTGDLLYASAANTLARRAIGTTGQVLTVSGGVPTWATPAGGGGKVLQVVQGTTTTMTTIATKTFTDTGITATITPSATTSKILVLVSASLQGRQTANNFAIGAKLLRGSTAIQDWSDYNYLAATMTGTTFCMAQASVSMSYLDSPSTTSATTYKVQGACDSTSNTAYWQINSGPSQIILMEIGA